MAGSDSLYLIVRGSNIQTASSKNPDAVEYIPSTTYNDLIYWIAKQYEKQCMWVFNYNGAFDTSCGNTHEPLHDRPKENGFNYCPYCGNSVTETEITPEQESE